MHRQLYAMVFRIHFLATLASNQKLISENIMLKGVTGCPNNIPFISINKSYITVEDNKGLPIVIHDQTFTNYDIFTMRMGMLSGNLNDRIWRFMI